jgi:DNA helicase-2/ATP-dependent DNA helicase PcrA
VIHTTDGCIPSDMATGDEDELEEERRLLYVALTRARDELMLTFPQRYYKRQKPRDDVHMYAVVSRFLDTGEVRVHLDARAPAIDVREDDAVEAASGTASVDGYLADLFG